MLLKKKSILFTFPHIHTSNDPMKERLKSQPQCSPCAPPPKPVQQTSASVTLCADALTTNPCHDSQGWDKLESTQLTRSKGPYHFVMLIQTATSAAGRMAVQTDVGMVSPALQSTGGCLTSAVPTPRQQVGTPPQLALIWVPATGHLLQRWEDAGGWTALTPMTSPLSACKQAKSQLGQTLHLAHRSEGVPRSPKC